MKMVEVRCRLQLSN